MAILTCYNKACSTKGKFDESENGEEACRYHPGAPVFHDALKVYIISNFETSKLKKRVNKFYFKIKYTVIFYQYLKVEFEEKSHPNSKHFTVF